MAMDGDDLRQRNRDHFLYPKRLREDPVPPWQRSRHRDKPSVRDDEAARRIAIPCFPGAFRRVPIVKGNADLDGIHQPESLRHISRQKVGQSTIKCHRRKDDGTAFPGFLVVRRQGLPNGTLLGGDVKVVDTGSQRCLNQRGSSIDKRSGAVDQGRRSVKRTVECVRVVARCHSPFRYIATLVIARWRAAPYRHHRVAAALQFANYESSGVSVRAIDGDGRGGHGPTLLRYRSVAHNDTGRYRCQGLRARCAFRRGDPYSRSLMSPPQVTP